MNIEFKKDISDGFIIIDHKRIDLNVDDKLLTDTEIKVKNSQEIVYKIVKIIEEKYNLKPDSLNVSGNLIFLRARTKEPKCYNYNEISLAYVIKSSKFFNKTFLLSSEHLHEQNINEIDVFNNLNSISKDKDINEMLKEISVIINQQT